MIIATLVNLDEYKDEFEDYYPDTHAALFDAYDGGDYVEILSEETDNYYNIKLQCGAIVSGISIDNLSNLRFKPV